MIRVALLDEHPAVRAGVEAILAPQTDLQPEGNTRMTYEVPFQIGRVEGARDESRRAVTMTRNECRRALLLRRGGDT
jgi:hypothetical protein